MGVGRIIQNCFETYTDPYTGVEVKRLTSPDHTSHHMYFYNRMTTADGKKLLYCAELEGQRQLYLMDLENGDAVQLTEGPGVADYNGVICRDDRHIFLEQNHIYYRLSLETYEKEELYRSPEGWSGSNPGFSEDDRFLVLTECREDTMAPPSKEGKWDAFAANCLAKPLCRIVYVDLWEHTSHVVLQENCWFGHPQLRPGDPDTILFCHEGPYDLIDARLWLVQSDGSRYRCCREQPKDLILTHEFWLPDGSKLAFVYREMSGKKEENIRMIDPDTLEEEVFMPCSPYAHFICDKRNRFMVGDAQSGELPIHLLNHDVKEERTGPGNDFIYLVDVKKRTEQKLCYHGTSWKARYGNSQDSHPHPCFTEDNQSIVFCSDREGRPCLYQVKL